MVAFLAQGYLDTEHSKLSMLATVAWPSSHPNKSRVDPYTSLMTHPLDSLGKLVETVLRQDELSSHIVRDTQ
jgi:hypothetical protein